MQVVLDEQVLTFFSRAGMLLEADEAANGLMLGVCSSFASRGPSRSPGGPPVLARVEVKGATNAAAVKIPPGALILTSASDPALEALLAALHARGISFPGLVGPAREAAYFAARWTELTGQRLDLAVDHRLFQLSRVTFPKPTPGRFRCATPADLDIVARWTIAFQAEAVPFEPQSAEALTDSAERRVRAGEMFVWDRDGTPVSMAGLAGPTAHGVRINAVYTPLELRGQGLASNLVAHLSQHALDSGKRFTFLFTDLSNPTSNRIYQQIGYVPIGDSQHYVVREE